MSKTETPLKPTKKNIAEYFNVAPSTLRRWEKDPSRIHRYYAFVDYFNKVHREIV